MREAGVDAPALSVLLTPPATNLQETG
jgi:hypothetical protein